MDSVRWDRLGDTAWLLLGMREAADGRKCKTYMPDTLFLDAVSSPGAGPRARRASAELGGAAADDADCGLFPLRVRAARVGGATAVPASGAGGGVVVTGRKGPRPSPAASSISAEQHAPAAAPAALISMRPAGGCGRAYPPQEEAST